MSRRRNFPLFSRITRGGARERGGGREKRSDSGEEPARIPSEEKRTAREPTGIIIIIIIIVIVIVISEERATKTGPSRERRGVCDYYRRLLLSTRSNESVSGRVSLGSLPLKFIIAIRIECNVFPPPPRPLSLLLSTMSMAEYDRQIVRRFIHEINAVECRDNGRLRVRFRRERLVKFAEATMPELSDKATMEISLLPRARCNHEADCSRVVYSRIDDWSSDFSFIEDDIELSICFECPVFVRICNAKGQLIR